MLKLKNSIFLYTFAVTLAGMQPCKAQVMNFSPDSDEPIEVTAEDGLELHQKEHKVYAYKNVKVTKGGLTLTADNISADYRQGQSGSNELWRLNAFGNVIMTSEGRIAKGENAEYLTDDDILTINGKQSFLDTNNEKIWADTLKYSQSKRIFTAKGNAKIVKEKGQVQADTISMEFAENENGKLEASLLTAEKNVVITTAEEKATGNKAVYSPKTAKAVLTGNVKLTKSGNTLEGGMATVDLNTGISRLFASESGDTANDENLAENKEKQEVKGEDKTLTEKNNNRVRGVFLPDSIKKSTSEKVDKNGQIDEKQQ